MGDWVCDECGARFTSKEIADKHPIYHKKEKIQKLTAQIFIHADKSYSVEDCFHIAEGFIEEFDKLWDQKC